MSRTALGETFYTVEISTNKSLGNCFTNIILLNKTNNCFGQSDHLQRVHIQY